MIDSKKTILLCCTVLAIASASRADTLSCGTVSRQNGKSKLSVKTVSANRCPNGYTLILNVSDLSQQILSSVPAFSGSSAGGVLTGTFPNPGLANGVVGPDSMAEFPTVRLALLHSAVTVLSDTPA